MMTALLVGARDYAQSCPLSTAASLATFLPGTYLYLSGQTNYPAPSTPIPSPTPLSVPDFHHTHAVRIPIERSGPISRSREFAAVIQWSRHFCYWQISSSLERPEKTLLRFLRMTPRYFGHLVIFGLGVLTVHSIYRQPASLLCVSRD